MFTVHHHYPIQNSDTEKSAMKMTIKQFDRTSMRLLAGAFSLITLLAVTQCAFAQQNAPALGGIRSAAIAAPANTQTATPTATLQAVRQPAEPAGEQEAPASQAKPGEEGIKVHGHWVIDVRNPDGSIVQHREFENSLQPNGAGFLVGLMSGYMVPGDYMILMLGTTGTNAPCASTNNGCGIAHTLSTYPALGYCVNSFYCTGSTLSYAYNFGANFAGPYSTVLSGTITANQAGIIGNVTAAMALCSNLGTTGDPSALETSSPATCLSGAPQAPWYGSLTGTTLTAPVPIAAGQIIQVTVTISFS
jgi:hypothetical protein